MIQFRLESQQNNRYFIRSPSASFDSKSIYLLPHRREPTGVTMEAKGSHCHPTLDSSSLFEHEMTVQSNNIIL
jgi:hypothetical protein